VGALYKARSYVIYIHEKGTQYSVTDSSKQIDRLRGDTQKTP